jgi:hypothetical protein
MFFPDPDLDFLPIPDPGVKKAPDPGAGSATLLFSFKHTRLSQMRPMRNIPPQVIFVFNFDSSHWRIGNRIQGF